MKIATIIINRNLPDLADSLYSHIHHYSPKTDIYVLEAGSSVENLSSFTTWHAVEDSILQTGLRFCRGTNYALWKLRKDGKWHDYDAFFVLTNDTTLENIDSLTLLSDVLSDHPRVGILSPCSKKWGEKSLLENQPTMYFWYIQSTALLFRRSFLDDLICFDGEDYMNLLFDGNNFRGYMSGGELIAKCYANNWAAAITTRVFAEENETYLLNKSDLIQTENYSENLKLYLEEGKKWLKTKYGFNSRWPMLYFSKSFYDPLFDTNPTLSMFKI